MFADPFHPGAEKGVSHDALRALDQMLGTFPAAKGLPQKMTDLILLLAELWAQNPERPRPAQHVCQQWDSLVADWAADQSLPLYIRKVNNNRGSVVIHASGRSLVPTDNSPAQWAFALAVLGGTPALEDIRKASVGDRIPVAMILKAAERAAAQYKCTLNSVVNPNSFGWKVAHIDGVGLGNRTNVSEVSVPTLQEHFRKFMNPRNMFVIPLKYAGLAELPEFCHALGAFIKSSK